MRPLAQLDISNLDDLPRAVKARADLDEPTPPSSGHVLAGLSCYQRQHEQLTANRQVPGSISGVPSSLLEFARARFDEHQGLTTRGPASALSASPSDHDGVV
jgi:hypothetical protein